jgi:hypothetical protein
MPTGAPTAAPTDTPTVAPTDTPTLGGVSAFNCAGTSGLPVQVYSTSNSANSYRVKTLDISTGTYTLVYNVPVSWDNSRLNSAGINPADGKVYATVLGTDNGMYLVRFDADILEFVAEISNLSTGSFNAGAFTTTGDYYVHNSMRFWKFSNLDLLPGYSSHSRTWTAGVDDFSAMAPVVTSTVSIGADFVIWYTADIADASGEHPYAMGIHGGKARLVNLDTGEGWELLSPSGTGFEGVWGSAWLYGGSLYFANNNGATGLIVVVTATINLSDLTVEWAKVSDSAATNHNDGMNCMGAPDPFPIPDTADLRPFNCSGFGGLPVQVYSKDAGQTYDVSTLNIESGEYSLLYKFPLDAGTFSQLDSAAINPVDGIPYATVRDVIDGIPNAMYLIRFDQNRVEWLAQLPGPDYNAGAFTLLTGEYWITGEHRKMMRLEHLNQLTGYATAAEATAGRDWSGREGAFTPSTALGNDFVVVRGSFDGSGSHQYSISAEDGFVILHKLDAIGTSWLLTPNAAFDGEWGSAWLYQGKT